MASRKRNENVFYEIKLILRHYIVIYIEGGYLRNDTLNLLNFYYLALRLSCRQINRNDLKVFCSWLNCQHRKSRAISTNIS